MEHKTPLNKVQQGILPEKNMIISYVNQVEFTSKKFRAP